MFTEHLYNEFRQFIGLFDKHSEDNRIFGIGNDGSDQNERDSRSRQLSNIEFKAKRSGTPFDIHHRDLVWPTHCPILGIELMRNGPAGNRFSVDKKIPELGYVKGNCRVISMKANQLKGTATKEDIVMFAKNILAYMEGKL